MTHDKIVDKLLKLKAMAEGAEAIGNEAEAAAFAEAFQRLMTTHKIEMTDLEFKAQEETDPVAEHRIDYTKYDANYKPKKVRIAWMETLSSIVARAHFCRILVYPGSSRIALIGRKQDAVVAEWMIVTMQRATEKIADKELQKYRWEVYKRDGNCAAAQGFRGAFIQAFVGRIKQRYDEIRREQAATVTGTGLMRLSKEMKAADAFIERQKEEKKYSNTKSLRRQSEWHGEGARRGANAADKINLGGKAVDSGRTTKGLI